MSYSNDTILDFFVVYYSSALNSVQAMEGSLKFCGQTYNTSVTSAQTKTNSIDSWGALYITYSTPRASGPPIYPLVGGQQVLYVDQDVFTAMGVALDQIFQGNWAKSDDGNQFFLTPDGSISTAAQVLSILLSNETGPMAALQNFTDKLSIALTNKYDHRSYSNLHELELTGRTASGQEQTATPYKAQSTRLKHISTYGGTGLYSLSSWSSLRSSSSSSL
jgi:hypothetical protein